MRRPAIRRGGLTVLATGAVALAAHGTAQADGVSPSCIPSVSTPVTLQVSDITSPIAFLHTSLILGFLDIRPIVAFRPRLLDEQFSPSGLTATAIFDQPAFGNVSNPTGPAEIDEITIGPNTGTTRTVAGLLVDPSCPPPVHPTATTVTCSPGSFAPGDATACTATVTDTAVAEAKAPTGTVTFSSSGAGRFGPSACTLSPAGTAARCTALFTAFALGGQTITAGYGGDATHAAGSGSATATVALPPSTPGCRALAVGDISPAGGGRARFLALAQATPARATGVFRDEAPSGLVDVRWSGAGAVTCAAGGTSASVFGTATRAGSGPVGFRFDLRAGAQGNRLRLRLADGYDTGLQAVSRGTVVIHARGG
jgi:hypothetical protein